MMNGVGFIIAWTQNSLYQSTHQTNKVCRFNLLFFFLIETPMIKYELSFYIKYRIPFLND